MKLEVFILELVRRERRDGREARKWRREDCKREQREDREKRKRQKGVKKTIEVEEEEHHHLPLLVIPQGTAVLLRRHEFPTRFSKALQQ